MKIKVLGCYGGGTENKGLTSFLINENLCLDAGNITGALNLEAQKKIENVIISHTHLDHIKDLPLLADNFIMQNKVINVYSHDDAITSLKENFFNNIIFPDFAVIPEKHPIIHYHVIENKREFKLNGLNILPIYVNHTVTNMGFLIDDGNTGFAYVSDTYITDEIYKEINKNKKIKFVIIEVSFPNEMEKIAYISKHLTPKLLEKELAKLRDDLKIFIYHLKPSYEKKIIEELKEIRIARSLEVLQDGYEISI